MDKAEFDRMFPDGINNTIWLFKKALHDIMTTDEIDKVIKAARGSEKRHLKAFKKSYLASGSTAETVAIWPALMAINSATLLRDIITVMVGNDKNVYRGE